MPKDRENPCARALARASRGTVYCGVSPQRATFYEQVNLALCRRRRRMETRQFRRGDLSGSRRPRIGALSKCGERVSACSANPMAGTARARTATRRGGVPGGRRSRVDRTLRWPVVPPNPMCTRLPLRSHSRVDVADIPTSRHAKQPVLLHAVAGGVEIDPRLGEQFAVAVDQAASSVARTRAGIALHNTYATVAQPRRAVDQRPNEEGPCGFRSAVEERLPIVRIRARNVAGPESTAARCRLCA